LSGDKAFFLDRDGVINKNRDDYVKGISEMEILPEVPKAIKLLNDANFKVVIITNQSAVDRGLISIETVHEIHEFLKKKMVQNDAKIDGIYFCPHRPDEFCECRKPKPALILKAAKDLGISLSKSYMIGDRESDQVAAERAGIKFIPIKTNGNLLQVVRAFLNENE
jgi:histidinol-phosphate phosphatase family protein